MMIFIPPERKNFTVSTTSYCQWCVKPGRKCSLFKIRDGPVDWYFCSYVHAEAWLEYRQKPETHELCRMPRQQRLEYLNGKTMEDEISRLFPERCEVKQP